MTQRVSHRPIKGTKVNGLRHGDNPLLRPTGIQIATKFLPGPTNRERRKMIGIKTMSLSTNYNTVSTASLSFLFVLCFLFCSHWSLVDVPLIFFCPADHVLLDWQPRILLGMVEARSINVKKTTINCLECCQYISESELQLPGTSYREDCLMCCPVHPTKSSKVLQ